MGRFRAPRGKFSLAKRPTRVASLYTSTAHHAEQLAALKAELGELQARLYAQRTHALLVIFQALDAAGKDSVIDHVLSGVNPQGCQVASFKRPSFEELAHDFLWRTNRRLPERGHIGVFNRSYYEEVLVVRVHPQFLAAQNLPPECRGKSFWRDRYRSILDMEAHLHRNGTRVVKFYLHLSKGEQRERFIQRIDEPDKNWKFNAEDVAERRHWQHYQNAYGRCIAATSSQHAPWYIVPADDKRNAQLIVATTLVASLRAIDPRWPKLAPAQRAQLKRSRAQLLAEPGRGRRGRKGG